MKKIFGYYGVTVVSILFALVLFSVLFDVSFGNRQNLQQILGTIIEEQLENHTRQTRMGAAFDNVAGQSLPSISLNNTDTIVKGKNIPLTQFLTASDCYGKRIGVRVEGVWKENLVKDTSVQLTGQTHLLFTTAGIYWLEVSAADARGYQRNCMVKIYVKEG